MSGRRLSAWLPVALALALATSAASAQEPRPTAPQVPVEPPRAAEDPVDPVPEAPDPDATPEPRAAARRSSAIRARGFGLVGFQSFTAADSFSAVLDSSSGIIFGGGGGLLLGRNLFVDVSLSRFSADGSRVFVTDGGEIIDLGIPAEVTVSPIDVSIGWRFAGTPRPGPTGKPGWRPVPFAGGGFGFQSYEETSEFADSGDDVSDTHGSYHVLGGVELPFGRHLGVTADAMYRWVPDAIGTGGVSAYYDETNLGGTQVRLRVVFTF